MLESFQRDHPSLLPDPQRCELYQAATLNEDLASVLRQVIEGLGGLPVSDERLGLRLLELLLALAEYGYVFPRLWFSGVAGRLRALIGDAPDRHWTAHTAGRALAMSEATLRRRLAAESFGFEDLLIDVRMHHAMMLLQTTTWSIPSVAQVCGYRSRARFSERFRARFGYLPSAVR